MNNEIQVVNINFFKKIWLSITKFERYPEMATEGTPRAILYLVQLILIFSLIISIGASFKIDSFLEEIEKYVDTNGENINYENGQSDTEKEIMKQLFKTLEIEKYDKQIVLQFIQTLKTPQGHVGIAIGFLISIWIAYFIASLINVILLSFFGWITSAVTGLKIRYRALFNMSIYAITISTILQVIYILVNLFINFEIKYFDIMYTAISYICLLAAIFMIKADVIKAQIEMIKMVEKKKQEQQQEPEEKKDETKEQEDEENEKSDKEEKKEKESGLKDVGEQGSNA